MVRMTRGLAVIAILGCSMLFVSSCAFEKNTASMHAKMEGLLKQKLVLLPADKFENLPSTLNDKEIIFLGEERHGLMPLHQAAAMLAVYLSSYKPVVYAEESCYGLSPFMEAASMGKPNKFKLIQIPDCIQEFNSKQTADRKILMTAIDLEHSIYHSKSNTVLFLQDLAGRSNSEDARQILEKEIVQLTSQDTYNKMNSYLKNLKKVFLQHFDTFSPEDKDEILFSMELITASNRYQYANRGKILSWQNPEEIRYRYFNKTIERAYKKTQKNKGILLCRVGSWHISPDYTCEARYFTKDYPATRGKVATIDMIPLYYDSNDANNTAGDKKGDIDTIVKGLMKDSKYSYLSLAELQKGTNDSLKWSKYYSKGRPKYEGLLFVKVVKNSMVKSQSAK